MNLTETICFKIDSETRQFLEEESAREYRSLSATIQRLIHSYKNESQLTTKTNAKKLQN